jgi:hypothetical protein
MEEDEDDDEVGKKALNFCMEDMNNKRVSLSIALYYYFI